MTKPEQDTPAVTPDPLAGKLCQSCRARPASHLVVRKGRKMYRCDVCFKKQNVSAFSSKKKEGDQ